ncbi:MAG TPA: hypothetical protein VEW48_10375 [Thermoanaerobaculia bacterium]|nr:hypothetical protein [Thermoanaerobaculia bacterium]
MKIAALLLVIFFAPIALCLSAPDRPARTVDPCVEARSIAEAPPCLEPHDCKAVGLWNQAFGAPKYVPTKPGQVGRLPQELLSRLPKSDFTLRKDESLQSLLKRLTEASTGVDFMVDQGIEGTYRGEPGTISLPEAWRRVATSGGLLVGAEGGVVSVTTPERAAQLSLSRPRTFNCPAH